MVAFFRNYLLVSILAVGFVAGCGSPDKSTVATEDSKPVAKADSETAVIQEEQADDSDSSDNVIVDRAGLLTVDTKVYDFGRIEPGGLKHGKFILKNEGNADLKISRVTAPCRCTTPGNLNGKVIAPGKTEELEFTFNVGSSHGKVQKKINVAVESPAKPATMTLTFEADIIKLLEVTPAAMNFGLHPSYDNSQTLVVNSTDGSEFKITGFLSNKNAVSLIHADNEEGRLDTSLKAKMHKLAVKVDLEKLKESPSGLLTIKTDHPKVNRLVVRYNTKMPFAAYPKTKRLVPSTEEGRQARIKVVSNFKQEFELGEITSEAGYLKVLETRPSVDGYEVHVILDMDKVAEMDESKRYVSDHLKIPIVGEEDVLDVHCYGMIH